MYRLAIPAAALALIASAPAAYAKPSLPTVRNHELPDVKTRNPRQHFHTVDDAVIADPFGAKQPHQVRKHYEKSGFLRGAWQVFLLGPHDAAGNSLTIQYGSAAEALAAAKHDAKQGPGKVTRVRKLPNGLMTRSLGTPGTTSREIFFARGTVEFRISLSGPNAYAPDPATLVALGRKVLSRA